MVLSKIIFYLPQDGCMGVVNTIISDSPRALEPVEELQ